MGVHIKEIYGGNNSRKGAILLDNVSGWVFGPVFDDYDMAQEFLEFIEVDPRMLSDTQLEHKHRDFIKMLNEREHSSGKT